MDYKVTDQLVCKIKEYIKPKIDEFINNNVDSDNL